jgi:hypothetical protein
MAFLYGRAGRLTAKKRRFPARPGQDLRGVLHMRVLRDEDPSKYMALLQMASQQAADELRQQHNGKFYSSMTASDPDAPASERCFVYYVSHVDWHPPAQPTDGDLALAAGALPSHYMIQPLVELYGGFMVVLKVS